MRFLNSLRRRPVVQQQARCKECGAVLKREDSPVHLSPVIDFRQTPERRMSNRELADELRQALNHDELT